MASTTGRAAKRRRGVGLDKLHRRYGYIFTATVALGLIFVYIPMFFKAFQYSINDIQMTSDGFQLHYVGLYYYRKFFQEDPQLLRQLVESLQSMLVDMLCITIFSIFVAVLLNQDFKGRTAARVIFFLPIVALSGVVGAVEQSAQAVTSEFDIGMLSGLSVTDVESLLRQTALSPALIDFISSAISRIYSIVTASGVQILVFLGGIQSIPLSLREAASVEGCSGWEFFWKITFPLLSPFILVNIVYTVIMSFTSASNGFMNKVTEMNASITQFSYASAVSCVYFLIIAAILGLIVLILRKRIVYLD